MRQPDMPVDVPADVPAIPETGFMRLPDVLKVVPVSKSTWFEKVREGLFPRPVKIGRSALYRAEDIRALVESISAGEFEESAAGPEM